MLTFICIECFLQSDSTTITVRSMTVRNDLKGKAELGQFYETENPQYENNQLCTCIKNAYPW